MDYKEEYEAIVQRCRELHESGNALTKQQMEIVCPQLKENEDERIRKSLVSQFKAERDSIYACITTEYDDTDIADKSRLEWLNDVLAYLEKQKPAEWLNGDMKEARENLIVCCRDWERGEDTTLLPIVATRARYFLEHLQQPAEWSEEDEKMRKHIVADMKSLAHGDESSMWVGYAEWLEGRLKSLHPQPHWKPSEEQLESHKNLQSQEK